MNSSSGPRIGSRTAVGFARACGCYHRSWTTRSRRDGSQVARPAARYRRPRLRRLGRGREGHRVLRAGARHRARDWRPAGRGHALGNLGSAYAHLGEVEKAIGYYEQHLVIAREIGDRQGEGNALGNLGTAYADLGEVEKAIGYYEQALVIAREIGDRQGEGNALGNLGVAYAAWARSRRPSGTTSRPRHRARDWRPAGRGQRPRQPRRSPTPTWARSRRPSGTTSSTSSSRARLATGGARAAPSATSASPTPAWARSRRPRPAAAGQGHRGTDWRPADCPVGHTSPRETLAQVTRSRCDALLASRPAYRRRLMAGPLYNTFHQVAPRRNAPGEQGTPCSMHAVMPYNQPICALSHRELPSYRSDG